ncbi:MAG: septum formation protein Maf [Chitinivibrionales bacterium]|nr:septum formation protein Maf [Chitinivibrionales bacterium]
MLGIRLWSFLIFIVIIARESFDSRAYIKQNVSYMSVWNLGDIKIILASQSPRRKQILEQMGLEFEIIVPVIPNEEEEYIVLDDVGGSLQRLADAKATSVSHANPSALVLGADTVVVINGEVLGKPRSADDAARMLMRLAGRMHYVYTAIAARCEKINFNCTALAETKVFFRNISKEDLEYYLAYEHYMDKAGAYAIQGKAMAFVDKIEGCFYNVMGLPVKETINLIEEFMLRKGVRDVG